MMILFYLFFSIISFKYNECTLNIWISDDSIKVLQQNQPETNYPTIPEISTAVGTQIPLNFTEMNNVWDSSKETVTLQGFRGEIVAFQIFLSGDIDELLQNMDVQITPLIGPGSQFNATLFLEWYVFEDVSIAKAVSLNISGNFPDPLIPFIDPYGSNQKIATPFTISPNETQGIWVDVKIPRNQEPGNYYASINVLSNDIVLKTLSLVVKVWNGTLPLFNSNESMIKAWIPLYQTRFMIGEVGSNPNWMGLVHLYQIIAREYCFDTQLGQVYPGVNYNLTSNITEVYDWSEYDLLNDPALLGSLFSDGIPLRVFDSPIYEQWGNGLNGWTFETYPPPKQILQLLESYALQISQHFTSKGWDETEILGYIFDQPYADLSQFPDLFGIIALYASAINNANDENQWVNPVRMFLTSSPACFHGFSWNGAACNQTTTLSYPSEPYLNSWILDWAPNACMYEPGPLNETPDLTVNGVSEHTSAPVPIKKWFWQYHEPFVGSDAINADALSFRTWAWIAYRYGVDGLFYWAANFWTSPSGGDSYFNDNSTSTYLGSAGNGGGIMFYPGAELPSIGMTNITGPVPSMRVSMWRRGYQDYLYLWNLEQLGLESEAKSISNSIIGTALNWEYANAYWYISLWEKAGNWSHNPLDYDQARLKMMELIITNTPSTNTESSSNRSVQSIFLLFVLFCFISFIY